MWLIPTRQYVQALADGSAMPFEYWHTNAKGFWHALEFGPLSGFHEALARAGTGEGYRIANALLAQGDDEGRAIRIGIAQAKRWAEHHQPDDGESWV